MATWYKSWWFILLVCVGVAGGVALALYFTGVFKSKSSGTPPVYDPVYKFTFATASTTTFTSEVGNAAATIHGSAISVKADGKLHSTTQTATVNSYVSLPQGLVDTFAAITVEGWISPTSHSPTWARIFDIASGSHFLTLAAPATSRPGPLRVELRRGSSNKTVITAVDDMDTTTRQHFCVCWGGGSLTFYLNGKLIQAVNAAGGPSDLKTDAGAALDVRLCQSIPFMDPSYDGTIDELCFYNQVLPASVVAAHYAAGPTA